VDLDGLEPSTYAL